MEPFLAERLFYLSSWPLLICEKRVRIYILNFVMLSFW